MFGPQQAIEAQTHAHSRRGHGSSHRQVRRSTAMSSATSSSATPRGLEGVVAASTKISHVFGEEGRLVYQGYEISELAGTASYEEVCYLLWHGKLPNAAELEQLNALM